jgi:hypothetical protein
VYPPGHRTFGLAMEHGGGDNSRNQRPETEGGSSSAAHGWPNKYRSPSRLTVVSLVTGSMMRG